MAGQSTIEGCYWGCGIGAGPGQPVLSPEGELLGWIEMPVTHPTMPCFGGPDLRTLYVTSLRENFTPEQIAGERRWPVACSPSISRSPVRRWPTYRG